MHDPRHPFPFGAPVWPGLIAALMGAVATAAPAWAAAILPSDIPGLQAWYRADQGITISGGGVSLWEDSSGLGRHMTQGSTSRRPLLAPDPGYDFLVVDFTSAHRWLSAGDGYSVHSNTDGLTAIYAVKPREEAGTVASQFTASPDLRQWRASVDLFDLTEAPGDAWTADTTAPFTGAVKSDWNILSGVWTPGERAQSYVNGVWAGEAAEPVSAMATQNVALLLGAAGGGGTNQLNGLVSEMILFNRALSDVERQGIEAYLQQKSIPPPIRNYPVRLVDGMVVHYTFDDASDLAADALGNQSGTLVSVGGNVPTQSTGLQGSDALATHVTGAGAINFEGIDGYMRVDDGIGSYLDTATGPGQARTVSFWFQTEADANQVIMEKGSNRHFVAQTGGDGRPFWRVNTGNVYSNAATQDGQWHHFVAMHADGVSYLYIDGVPQGLNWDTAPVVDINPLVLGARLGGGFAYDGKLDDVAVWNRLLTPAEVQLMFKAGQLGLDVSRAALPYQILGVTYEYGEAATSKPNPSYRDIGGIQLTDIYSTLNHTNDFNHSAWVGFRDNPPNPDSPHPEVTFDLHGVYNLDEIRMIYLGGNHAQINPPDSVWVSFSEDGLAFSDPTMFTPFSPTPSEAGEHTLAVEEALIEIGGEWTRYVRMEFRNSGQWTFLGDVAFVAVPEPNTLLLLAMGGLLLLIRRRRRDAGR